jgi:hypothetical protein
MSNLYRLTPTLWNDATYTNQQALTVYAVYGVNNSTLFTTTCARRPSADPAYSWDSPTFSALLLSNTAVTWFSFIPWLQSVSSLGYTVQGDISRLKAYSDIYVMGP